MYSPLEKNGSDRGTLEPQQARKSGECGRAIESRRASHGDCVVPPGDGRITEEKNPSPAEKGPPTKAVRKTTQRGGLGVGLRIRGSKSAATIHLGNPSLTGGVGKSLLYDLSRGRGSKSGLTEFWGATGKKWVRRPEANTGFAKKPSDFTLEVDGTQRSALIIKAECTRGTRSGTSSPRNYWSKEQTILSLTLKILYGGHMVTQGSFRGGRSDTNKAE